MSSSSLVNSKDVFEAVKAEYLKSGWSEKNENEIVKDTEHGRNLIMRLSGDYIDLRMNYTGEYTSVVYNEFDKSELEITVQELKDQFSNTEQTWREHWKNIPNARLVTH